MRQFRIESPEPKDVKALKAAYPEGTYEFTGRTFTGATFVGKSTLSHRLPATAKFGTPAPEAEDVSIKDVKISWGAVAGVASYIVKIEHDELGTKIEAVLPSSLTSFAVPNGFLMPGTEYELGIGTVTAEGNVSFVETSFTTKIHRVENLPDNFHIVLAIDHSPHQLTHHLRAVRQDNPDFFKQIQERFHLAPETMRDSARMVNRPGFQVWIYFDEKKWSMFP